MLNNKTNNMETIDEKNVRFDNYFTVNSGRSSPAAEEDVKKPSGGAYNKLSGSIRHFHEFCKSTSIHGMQYLGETRRPNAERVCWVLILMVSVAVCLYSILDKWNKFENSPVIVSFAETTTPIWQIPFPAVTVCSFTRSRATVFNYTRVMIDWRTRDRNITEQDKEMFEAVSLMCIHRDHPGGEVIDKSALDVLKKVGAPLSETVSYVRWRNIELLSESVFHPVLLTDHGVCFTFNMLNAKQLYTDETEQNEYFLTKAGEDVREWSLDDGYTKKAGLEPYPHRGLGTRVRNGLILAMDAYDDDLDYVCHGPHQGFKVFIHNPAEVPSRSSKFIHVPLNQEVDVAVQPTLMTTSEDLRGYSPARRQCHYPSDRKLRFFSVYTQANCAFECVTNYTRYMCDCVAFYMPHAKNTTICGPQSWACLEYAAGELPKKEIKQILRDLTDPSHWNSSTASEMDKFDYKECDCLPTCSELQYETKTTQTDLPWRQVLHGYGELGDKRQGLNKARVNIFFDDMQFLTSRRSELYGRTDFLASCGGLLGLFMGFSILSLVEIVYFFTIRACCNLAKPKKKKNEDDLLEDKGTDLEESKLQLT